MSFFLRTSTNDLSIPRQLISDPASCARQQAVDVLQLWAQEWFLDQNLGFPWGDVLGLKIVNTTQIQALLEQAILSVQGVVSVTATVSFDRVRRAFSYSFTAPLDTGQILSGGSNVAFSVSSTPAGG